MYSTSCRQERPVVKRPSAWTLALLHAQASRRPRMIELLIATESVQSLRARQIPHAMVRIKKSSLWNAARGVKRRSRSRSPSPLSARVRISPPLFALVAQGCLVTRLGRSDTALQCGRGEHIGQSCAGTSLITRVHMSEFDESLAIS